MNAAPHPEAMRNLRQGLAALQAGQAEAALRSLAAAEAIDPSVAEIQLNQALAHRAVGDFAAGIAAIDRLLERQPAHFVALLSKANMIEAARGPRDAARTYRAALRLGPDPKAPNLPPALAEALAHADQVVREDGQAVASALVQGTAAARAALPEAERGRFDESLAAYAGTGAVPVQKPLLLQYSRLPAIPFYDRAHFPWLAELEAATDMIAGELRAALRDANDSFVPYIRAPKGVAVNQWGELNHSRRWSSFFLWKDGVRFDDACARCSGTSALIDRLPLMRQPGFAPTALFSALEPHTHIPPHTGSANTRLLCHLPLILPGPARFRVGSQVREWRMGEAFVFDDTIEHEAWNDADEMRVIMILDLWSPFLSQAERAAITAMQTARNAYYKGDEPG